MRSTVLIRASRIIFFPFVEDGTLTLIGATTENPYFEVNGRFFPDPVFLS